MRLGFALTRRCNLSCPHCLRSARAGARTRSLEPELVERVLDAALELWGRPLTVGLTGGEPTLHPAWERIVAALHRREVTYRFTSNGWDLARVLPTLERYPPEAVRLSLSGATAPVHDRERGRDSFRRVLLALALLTSRRIPTSLSLLVDRRDRHQLREAAELAESLGCVGLGYILPQPVPASAARESDLSPAEWGAVAREVAALAAEPGRRTRLALDLDRQPGPCQTLALRRVYVDAAGRLCACCQLSEYGGNAGEVVADLHRVPLAQAWPLYVERVRALAAATQERADGPGGPVRCLACAAALGKLAWLGEHPLHPWATLATRPGRGARDAGVPPGRPHAGGIHAGSRQ